MLSLKEKGGHLSPYCTGTGAQKVFPFFFAVQLPGSRCETKHVRVVQSAHDCITESKELDCSFTELRYSTLVLFLLKHSGLTRLRRRPFARCRAASHEEAAGYVWGGGNYILCAATAVAAPWAKASGNRIPDKHTHTFRVFPHGPPPHSLITTDQFGGQLTQP